MYRVIQLSDTHFALKGNRSHHGFGYDTDLAWDRVHAAAFGSSCEADAVVVTGDLVDHGLPAEYEHALRQLARIELPTNVVPGNHDFDQPFRDAVADSPVVLERSTRVGPWEFLFADSNGEFGDTDERISTNGLFSQDELEELEAALSASDAEFIWLWMHHPPAMQGTWAHEPRFDAQVAELLERHPRIQGIGAGHVHVNEQRAIAERPVYVCPAFTIGFDMPANTTLPPGWREWAFHDDGTVESICRLVDDDDEAWPRFDLPEPVADYQRGELSWDEMIRYMEEVMALIEALE